MSDALLFIAIFGGLFVIRIIAATIVFCWLLPAGDRCPHCDAPTLWIRSSLWLRPVRRLRSSWCPECGWHGTLRHGPRPPSPSCPPPIAAPRRRAVRDTWP